jgi:hypothetical protein
MSAVATIVLAASSFLEPAQAAAQDSAPRWSLPFELGVRVQVGYVNGEGTHLDVYNRFAIDFAPLTVGTPFAAMESGTVVYVKEDTSGPTGNWHDNNEIAIEHADGSVSVYCHLAKDGAIVRVGDRVMAGDRIGYSGDTGNSTTPHLHVDRREKTRTGKSLPFRFLEAAETGGDLKRGQNVESRNQVRRGALAELIELAEDYAIVAPVDAREVLSTELARLLDDRRAEKAAAALARSESQPDLSERYRQLRSELIARWRKEAADREAASKKVLDSASVEDALVDQRIFEAEFGLCTTGPAKEGATKGKADARIARRREFLRAMTSALKADRNARRELRAGERPKLQQLESLYTAASAKAANADQAAR